MAYILSNPVYMCIFAFVFFVMYMYASVKANKTGKPHYRFMKGILAAIVILIAISVVLNGMK